MSTLRRLRAEYDQPGVLQDQRHAQRDDQLAERALVQPAEVRRPDTSAQAEAVQQRAADEQYRRGKQRADERRGAF